MKKLILIAALWAPSALAQTSVTAEADHTQIAPGETFRVLVTFEMEPEWHIYWKNPGDSGLPTEVMVEAPDGVTVSDWRFPVPVEFGQPGGLSGYGYGKEVALVADVSVESEFTGDSVDLPLVVDWLMCKDRCIPGHAEPTVSVSVGATSEPVDELAAAIDEWDSRVPAAGDPPFAHELTTGKTDDDKTHVSLQLVWPEDVQPNGVNWIPNPAFELSITDILVEPADGATSITFAWAKWGDPPSSTLPSVVTWTDDEGTLVGHELEFDLD